MCLDDVRDRPVPVGEGGVDAINVPAGSTTTAVFLTADHVRTVADKVYDYDPGAS